MQDDQYRENGQYREDDQYREEGQGVSAVSRRMDPVLLSAWTILWFVVVRRGRWPAVVLLAVFPVPRQPGETSTPTAASASYPTRF